MQNISDLIKDECSANGLNLIDLKLEFGRDSNGTVMLIDEVSGDIMRVTDRNNSPVDPVELAAIIIK